MALLQGEVPVLLDGHPVGRDPPAGAQVADQVPVQRARRSCRRSPDTSGRVRRGRCRRSSRRTGSRRSPGRSRSWCRCRPRRGCRAPSSVASARCRYSSPCSAVADMTSPSRNSSSTPRTSTPAGDDGIVKRILPVAEDSCGPVKTSPEGMLRLPSLLTQVRLVDLEPQVGALGLDAQLARARQAIDQRGLEAAQLVPAAERDPAGRGTARGRRSARSRRAPSRRARRWRGSATASSTSAS